MINSGYSAWLTQMVATLHEKKFEYLISRAKNDKEYFYYNFDYITDTTFQLLWTPRQARAFPFESEQEVEEFKSDYISPRKASIIRVHRTSSMMEWLG